MPGDDWQKHANLRALYAYMWAHPGKKLIFMGAELAQEQEWSHERSLDWHLLDSPATPARLVRDLNRLYRETPALWELDAEPGGFRWLVVDDRDANVVAFARFARDGHPLVAAANLSPVPRNGYRLPMPRPAAGARCSTPTPRPTAARTSATRRRLGRGGAVGGRGQLGRGDGPPWGWSG